MAVSVAVAVVLLTALPVIAALALESGRDVAEGVDAAATGLVVAIPTRAVTSGATYQAANPAHAASMLVVGTLLIGIGSMVRRAA